MGPLADARLMNRWPNPAYDPAAALAYVRAVPGVGLELDGMGIQRGAYPYTLPVKGGSLILAGFTRTAVQGAAGNASLYLRPTLEDGSRPGTQHVAYTNQDGWCEGIYQVPETAVSLDIGIFAQANTPVGTTLRFSNILIRGGGTL